MRRSSMRKKISAGIIDSEVYAMMSVVAAECSPWNAVFDVTVTDVLADASDPHREGQSFVRGGVPFYCDPSWAAGRTAVLAELLSDIHR